VRYWPTTEDDSADRESVVTDSEEASDERPPPAKAVPIHKAVLSPASVRYSLTNRGGLSHREGWVCWSAVDRVICGRLEASGSIVDVRTVLHHEAVAGNVCHGIYRLYSPNYTWLVTSRLDTTRHVRRVEPVELVMSSVSSRAVRQARHSQNAWARHVERVESCRNVA